MNDETLKALIADCLSDIDQLLSDRGMQLRERPLAAARIFVDECIIEIEGESKDDYLAKRWFAMVFAEVFQWYQRKYGDALERSDDDFPAVIVIHGMPYSLRVPLTHSVSDVPGETIWLSFEIHLGPTEKPRKWIITPPALDALSEVESHLLDEDLKSVTRLVRAVNQKLTMANSIGAEFEALRTGALLALRSAADHILQGTKNSWSLAMWDLNFALENALKAVITQTGKPFSHTHDLTKLLKECEDAGRRPFPDSEVGYMPLAKQIIEYRYGTKLVASLKDVLNAYNLTLERLEKIAEKLQRDVDVSGARFKIARAPWLAYLPEFLDRSGGMGHDDASGGFDA